MAVRVVVRAEVTGAQYLCERNRAGDWQCGRCDVGIIPAQPGQTPPVGAFCLNCSAKVIGPPGAPLGRLLWLIVLIGLALVVAALIRQLL